MKKLFATLTAVAVLSSATSAFAATWPVPDSKRITQKYSSSHKGLDIGAKTPGKAGNKIVSSFQGKVVFSGFHKGSSPSKSYGYLVVVNHTVNKKNVQTWYAHLNKQPVVKNGDAIKEGQKVGEMGQTGNSQGVHLHFETRNGTTFNFGNKTFDPLTYFPKSKTQTVKDEDLDTLTLDEEDTDTLALDEQDQEESVFYSVEELEQMTPEERIKLGIPVE